MGVTGNKNNPYDLHYISNELNHIENYIEQAIVQDSNMAVETTPAEQKEKKCRKSRFHKCYLDRTVRATKKGVRQARRKENTNFLLMVSEKDEPVDVQEVDFVDLMEHGLTPFAKLFMEQEKMKIWNDFINQSEDDQRDVLTGNHGDIQGETGDQELVSVSVPGCERQDSTGSWEEVEDRRNAHPAYSADECFQRIEHKLQSFLKKRHLALGTLLNLEEDIISFFMEWPKSVYVSRLESSYDRMILHALCQYLNLDSWSYDDNEGVRQTQVENLHTDFILPPMTLSNYIEYRNERH